MRPDKKALSRYLLFPALLVLAGCATIPGDPSQMTAEQIKEAVKDKSATVGCATVQTPYKGNTILMNLDKGVLQVGEITVTPECQITIKNAPPPKAPKPVSGGAESEGTFNMPVTVPPMTLTPSAKP